MLIGPSPLYYVSQHVDIHLWLEVKLTVLGWLLLKKLMSIDYSDWLLQRTVWLHCPSQIHFVRYICTVRLVLCSRRHTYHVVVVIVVVFYGRNANIGRIPSSTSQLVSPNPVAPFGLCMRTIVAIDALPILSSTKSLFCQRLRGLPSTTMDSRLLPFNPSSVLATPRIHKTTFCVP